MQLSSSGQALAYFGYQAFPGAVGNTAFFAAHVSTRTANGWQTREWTPNVPKAEVLKSYKVSYTFSEDLSQAILQIPLIPLVPEATPYITNLFLRNPQGQYYLINNATPKVSAEEICGPERLSICWQFGDASAYAGASRDFRHVIFESNAQLTNEAPTTSIQSLYESSGGSVRLVGLLPDGLPAATSTAGAGSSVAYASGEQEADHSVERAMSQDGSHVIFQGPADGNAPDPEQSGLTEVYDRINSTETIEISLPALEATPSLDTAEPSRFQTASVDGSRVFFTSSAELTTQSYTGESNNGEDLYEYDLGTKQLTDLTIDTNTKDAAAGAMVLGVVDASSDGSYVYFVANGQLVEGKGVDGQPNLYMVHNGGKPVFIATLNSGGLCRFTADPCNWTPFPAVREAYVTPDGLHMAFMSSRSLPTVNFANGYDNIDQETGTGDSEVYLYTAPTKSEGTGQLICASCNPTGTRPVGSSLLGGISPNGAEQGGKLTYSGISTPFYRVRPLSENGKRLFYTAPASLTTPNYSLFEYELGEEGSCDSTHGCQSLISTPGNEESDYFLGSSADGIDVFFATSTQLASTDTDNLRDVYDARVDGGIATTLATPPCSNQCHVASSLQTIPQAESLTLGPVENLSTPQSKVKCTKRGFKLSHGKCVKLKKKHKRQSRTKLKAVHNSRKTR